MNDKPETKIGYISPLKRICMTIGELPTSYLETMSYYEMLVWFVEFLKNQVIPVVNNNSEATEELQHLFIELQSYVNNYFDNLDVQEEINNKLDKMLEDGVLEQIIEQYLNSGAIWGFNNVNEMKQSTNLIDGSYAKTLGHYETNDGGGALYKITDTESENEHQEELENGLYATLINDLGDNYYDEITYVKERHYDTDCYFTTIPKNDKENKEIVLYVDDVESESSPTKYARDNFTTLTINASLKLNINGSVIANGEILNSADLSSKSDAYKYLGIKANRVLKEYQANQTTAEDMLNDGCQQAFLVYYTLIKNGVIQDMTLIPDLDGSIATSKHPRQCLGQKQDGTIIILTCDGRTDINAGLTSEETAILLNGKGCINAWNLDGGGSTSTTIKASKINRNIDNGGTTDRHIDYVLNAKKTTIDKELAKLYSQIGFEKQDIIQQIIPNINDLTSVSYYTNVDLNTLIGKKMIAYLQGVTNKPQDIYITENENGFYFVNIPHPQSQYKNLYNLQFIMRRDYNEIYTRRQVNGVFTDWTCINSQNKAIFRGVIGEGNDNTITTTNNYQDIVFESSLSNNYFIKRDETSVISGTDKFTRILVDRIGFANVRVSGTITCVSTGTKFIKIQLGNNDSAIYSFSANSTGRYVFVAEALERITSGSAKTFKVQMYGSQGDYIQRCHVLVDFDR